jgi:hypothetical protein
MMGRGADASLAREMRLSAALASKSPPQAPRIHSTAKISRFVWRGALGVMLDSAGGDMVHPPFNLRPLKEKRGRWDNNSSAFVD